MVFSGLCRLVKTGCTIYAGKNGAYQTSRTLFQREIVARFISSGRALLNSEESQEKESLEERDPALDRTKQIPVETSIQYLKSEAYKHSYGTDPVWTLYRRNFKGPRQPRFTRKTCIRKGVISTGNPCPICRDEYLVLHHENIELLKQFISPHTGEVLSFLKTGLCQKRHQELLVAIEKAKDYGYLTYDVPFREYDYSLYYKN